MPFDHLHPVPPLSTPLFFLLLLLVLLVSYLRNHWPIPGQIHIFNPYFRLKGNKRCKRGTCTRTTVTPTFGWVQLFMSWLVLQNRKGKLRVYIGTIILAIVFIITIMFNFKNTAHHKSVQVSTEMSNVFSPSFFQTASLCPVSNFLHVCYIWCICIHIAPTTGIV